MQTHEVCKNDNIIIFRRETQKHFFIRAVAKHKKGRNSRKNFFKNIVMVRKKKTLLSTFAIVSLNHDKCYFDQIIGYFFILIGTLNEIHSLIDITMMFLQLSLIRHIYYPLQSYWFRTNLQSQKIILVKLIKYNIDLRFDIICYLLQCVFVYKQISR